MRQRNCITSLISALTLLGGATLLAQPSGAPDPGATPFALTGSSLISTQYSSQPGAYSLVPASYWRWELNPGVAIYGVPFVLNIMLSSEQDPQSRQNINTAAFSLDLGASKLEQYLRDKAIEKLSQLDELKSARDAAGSASAITDSLAKYSPEKLADMAHLDEIESLRRVVESGSISDKMDVAKQFGLLDGVQSFFADFPALGVGTVYPQYTMNTLSGIPVTGANIEYNPGKFYIAIAGGKVQKDISPLILLDSSDSAAAKLRLITPTYSRELYAARLGYGRKTGEHVILTAMYARDDPNSFPLPDSATTAALDSAGLNATPQGNYVFGVDAQFDIVPDMLNIAGELVGSILKGDVRDGGITLDSDIPTFASSVIEPNMSTYLDFYAGANTTLDLKESDTRVMAGVKMVGPGFRSLGAPNQRNDYMRIESRVDQKFVKRQVGLTAFYRREHDNLVDLKSSTTTLSAYGIGASLTFRNLPYLRVNYTPTHQTNDVANDTFRVDNTTQMITANAGYGYKIGTVSAQSSLTFANQSVTTNNSLYDYNNQTIGVNQFLTFEFPLQLSLGLSFITPTFHDSTGSAITTIDFSATHTLFDIWQNSIGVAMAIQESLSKKTGFWIATSLPLNELLQFQLRAETNSYTDQLDRQNNFSEFVLRASLQSTW